MVDAARARKLAVRIKEIVADMVRRQIKDPRVDMVTITDVKITGDLRDATVYYTVFGDETQWAEAGAALDSATGVLRSAVGKQTGVRYTPTLAFVADKVPEGARQLDELLEKARQSDAAVRATAAGATYAGDADPYKHDEDDE
ncbi:30S ribosome-binding factor RbfA [Fodinicola acaciae]|uniref:30S ribosome-binding factor RbfA n=1 Tax=Fodinicola acaciae TaxID=2681555 RepID=UPI0013D40FE1|nr:30S ribosome-binding factor RbfA [Fodinicola acaciae]